VVGSGFINIYPNLSNFLPEVTENYFRVADYAETIRSDSGL